MCRAVRAFASVLLFIAVASAVTSALESTRAGSAADATLLATERVDRVSAGAGAHLRVLRRLRLKQRHKQARIQSTRAGTRAGNVQVTVKSHTNAPLGGVSITSGACENTFGLLIAMFEETEMTLASGAYHLKCEGDNAITLTVVHVIDVSGTTPHAVVGPSLLWLHQSQMDDLSGYTASFTYHDFHGNKQFKTSRLLTFRERKAGAGADVYLLTTESRDAYISLGLSAEKEKEPRSVTVANIYTVFLKPTLNVNRPKKTDDDATASVTGWNMSFATAFVDAVLDAARTLGCAYATVNDDAGDFRDHDKGAMSVASLWKYGVPFYMKAFGLVPNVWLDVSGPCLASDPRTAKWTPNPEHYNRDLLENFYAITQRRVHDVAPHIISQKARDFANAAVAVLGGDSLTFAKLVELCAGATSRGERDIKQHMRWNTEAYLSHYQDFRDTILRAWSVTGATKDDTDTVDSVTKAAGQLGCRSLSKSKEEMLELFPHNWIPKKL